MARSIGSQASTELLDCSVISNWTGRPVFFWTIVARCRTFTPEQTSSNRSLTRSQARSLLSIARLKIARSRLDRAISRRTRMDQNVLRLKRFLLADEQSLVPRLLASVDRTCRHRGSSATPPSASLYSERMTLVPTDHSGFPHERAHYDRFWRKAVVSQTNRSSCAGLCTQI